MSVSYFVRYEGRAENEAEFLRYYRDQHAPILARFTGIRGVVLHSPLEYDKGWRDKFPVNPDRFMLLAQMIFDTPEDLERAMQCEARAEARADFARFPKFEGSVLHQAAISREVALPRVDHLVLAGWTGRDQKAIEAHVREMKHLGVDGPPHTPMFYRVSSSLLTTAGEIETIGKDSSGEAEYVVFNVEGELFVGAGSDHTDRKAESAGITLAKQMCAKVVAPGLWRFRDVEPHWDELILRSWADGVLYQEGSVAAMRHPRELMEIYKHRTGIDFADGCAMFGGTLASIGGIRWADEFAFELSDPVLQRAIAHKYKVRSLPVEG